MNTSSLPPSPTPALVQARHIVLLGPPGAGKGTQAKRLEKILKLPHVASGDIFREIRQQDTPLARQIQEFMDRGEYVPDALTIELVLARLDQPDARRGFLLDGFPRTQVQARALDQALAAEVRRVDRTLHITAPPEVLVRRLAGRIICPQCHAVYNAETNPPQEDMICDMCGHQLERRNDEAPAVVERRLEAFMRQTQPLVEYYCQRDLLVEIDGNEPLEVVEAEVDAAIRLEVQR